MSSRIRSIGRLEADDIPSQPRGPVPLTHLRWGVTAVVYASLMIRVSLAVAAIVHNPTGLPVYPNIDNARLEDRLRTDDLGRWCIHLYVRSSDSLATVENWYRHALSTASETDLRNDGDYERSYVGLDGIKLTMDLAFVAVYKASNGAATSIDIVRCGSVR
jgi:hypothetical protein